MLQIARALEETPVLEEVVSFYPDDANLGRFAEDTYVQLSVGTAGQARGQFEDRTAGTVFEDGELPEGQTLKEALRESS